MKPQQVSADGRPPPSTLRDRTLATRYQPKQQLPQDFSQVLKDYTREVLRDQPEDILAWSAEYFKKLAIQEDPSLSTKASGAQGKSSNSKSDGVPLPAMRGNANAGGNEESGAAHSRSEAEELQQDPLFEELRSHVAEVLGSQDGAQSGFLPPHVVKRTLQNIFGLTTNQSLYVLSNAFVVFDSNGNIEIKSFVRECVFSLQFFQETGQDFAPSEAATLQPGSDFTEPVVHGLTREALEKALTKKFESHDDARAGKVSFSTFREALQNAPAQFTQRDIAVLSVEAERVANGDITYREEVKSAFDRLLLAEQFTLFDENDGNGDGEEGDMEAASPYSERADDTENGDGDDGGEFDD